MLSAFKNFGVTFIIALLIFGVGAYFATAFVTSTMSSILSSEKEQLDDIFQNKNPEDDPVNPPNIPVTPEDEIQGDSFSLLLVITDYRPDLYGDYMPNDPQVLNEKAWNLAEPFDAVGYLSREYREITASSIVLVRADKEAKQYTYTYFSPESRVYTPTGYHTLGQVYSYYGLEHLSEYINSLTGIRPSYKMVMNGYNLDELVNLLGPITVNVGKDIWFDGREYTTHYEYTRNAVDDKGVSYVEHVPNTFTLGQGEVELNGENIYILSSLSERSMSDITLKEGYTIDIVKQYLTRLSEMEPDARRILVSQLTINETEWVNIEGYGQAEGETESGMEAETPPPETAEPETEPVPEEGAETEEGEEEEVILFEPETPVIETIFSAAHLEKINGVLEAITTFENLTVGYPGSYVPAGDDHGAYFEPNLKTGVDKFLGFRDTKTPAETTEN